jgi:flagellar capping protein FliD
MNSIGSFSGLASGIQWRDLVDEMIRAERVRRVNPLSQQVSQDQRRIDAWGAFRTAVTRLEAASRKLQDGSAFAAFSTSGGTSPTSGRALVSASATESAAPGTYQVEVLGTARTEKAGMGAGVADATAELGFSGTFYVNEKAITVEAGDSLNDIRDRINDANKDSGRTGVTATIITPQEGQSRLMLTADSTGWNGIELRDGVGGVLQQLGILDAGAVRTENRTVDGKLSTQRLTAAGGEVPANSVASLLGLSTPPLKQRVIVSGKEIEIDLQSDTLQDLLNKVRDAGGQGRIVTENIGGRDLFRLEVEGEVRTADDNPDGQEVLDLLGFTRTARTQEVAGADAHIRLDSIDVVRRTNTVSGVVPGVTLAVQNAEPGVTTEVNIRRNTQQAIDAVKDFASAYNEVLRFTNNQRAAGQPLAGNGTLRTTMSGFTDVLLTPTTGLDLPFERATLLGVSLTRTGTLEVDETKLREMLGSNLQDVRTFFTGKGQGTDAVAGLAGRMLSNVSRVTRSGDGTIALQVDSLNRSIDGLNRRRDDAEVRLEVRREALLKQFIAMETAMQTIQGQGNWLNAQLDAMRPRRDR